MRKKPLKISWRSWCLYKLARRDYSAFEMRTLIQKRAADSDQEVDPVPIVSQLVEEGILDDERYVTGKIRFYTESTYRKGPKKLRDELTHKGGIAPELLDKYLDDNDAKWFGSAKKNRDKILFEKGLNAEVPQQIPDKLYLKIKRSLYTKGFTRGQIDSALEGFKPYHERTPPKPPGDIQKLVESRMSSGKGPYDIRQTLLQKGVEKETVQNYLDYPEEIWQEIAAKERIKRFGEQKPKTFKEKKKQTDFLQRRGFSFDQIRAVL